MTELPRARSRHSTSQLSALFAALGAPLLLAPGFLLRRLFGGARERKAEAKARERRVAGLR